MKKIRYTLLLLSFLSLALGCKKEENLNREIVGLGGDTWPDSNLDQWLMNNFTIPYNISVKYRWDGTEYDNAKTLVPAMPDRVQPLMETVKSGWIEPYIALAGENFIKKYAPKNYVLVGSLQYNSGGSVTLGEAEGGVKVTLFNVNKFTKTERPVAQRVLKTIHHEFAHILHQNISYQKEYPQVTPSGYTADWNNTSLAEANNKGFITTYAQASPDEDFVEMAAIMLTEGRSSYNAIVNSIVKPKLDSIPDPAAPPFIIVREVPNDTAQAFLRAKEQMVITYYKQNFNIDFASLQNRVNYALAQNGETDLATLFGNRKKFTSLTVSPNSITGMSPAFMTVWNNAKAGLAAVPAVGRVLNSFTLFFYPKAGELVLRVNYTNSAAAPFVANFAYKVTYNGNQMSLTYLRRDANADVVGPGLTSLTDYLASDAFSIKWYYDANFREYGQLTKVSDPGSFFYGDLGVIKY